MSSALKKSMSLPLIKTVGKTKSTIMFFHGMFCTKSIWEKFSIDMSSKYGYNTMCIDFLNHGDNQVFDGNMTYDRMTELVYDFLLSQNMKNIHLVGHSLGGQVAMQIAFNEHKYCPENPIIRSLSVLDMAPADLQSHIQYQILDALKVLKSIDINEEIEKKCEDHDNSKKLGDDHLVNVPPQLLSVLTLKPNEPLYKIRRLLHKRIPHKTFADFLITNIKLDQETNTYRWAIDPDIFIQNFEKLMKFYPPAKKYSGRARFFRGFYSKFLIEDDIKPINKHFENAKLISIPNAGHQIHLQNEEALMEEIHNFITEE